MGRSKVTGRRREAPADGQAPTVADESRDGASRIPGTLPRAEDPVVLAAAQQHKEATMYQFRLPLRRGAGKKTVSRKWPRGERPLLRLERLEAREMLTVAGVPAEQIRQAYGQIPMSFEANVGQTDPRVRYLARGSGYTLFLTGDGAVLNLRQAGDHGHSTALAMHLVGGNPAPAMEGLDDLPGKVNYFRGNDASGWQTGAATFGRVRAASVYPGIDAVYYGNQRQLEYDFVVAPGADPSVIAMNFTGADRVNIDAQGNLVLHTAGGDVVHHAPVVYQDGPDRRQSVAGHYTIRRGNTVRFDVGAYDHGKPLVIDPVLGYSTFLGSANYDVGMGIAVDSTGNAYLTGFTDSLSFPTTSGAFQPTYGGGNSDAFVTKLDASGSFLWYSTYFGGNGDDRGRAIAVDAFNDAYVTGSTTSTNLYVSPGAFQGVPQDGIDAFVTRLNAFGVPTYSTYLGGIGYEYGFGVAVDGSRQVYVTGSTTSPNFPVSSTAYQHGYGDNNLFDGFVTKLNPGVNGSAQLVYSTYLGGSATDQSLGVALNPTCTSSCDAFVTGYTESANFPLTTDTFQTVFGGATDAFVTRLNGSGSAAVFSTYLGGNGDDAASGIAVDAVDDAYVTGVTYSTSSPSGEFPATAYAYQKSYHGGGDLFVTKVHHSGKVLEYSTYLGGAGNENATGIAVDANGFAYVTGTTSSADYPVTATSAPQKAYAGNTDAVLTRVNPLGTALDFSTYLGGSGAESANGAYDCVGVDQAGNAYVIGSTASADFPVSVGAYQTTYNGASADAFVTKISPWKPAAIKATPGPTNLLSTGLSATGSVLPLNSVDPHYTFSGPDGTPPNTLADSDKNRVPNGPTSRWIRVNDPDNHSLSDGLYHFYVTFSLPASCGALIMGRWTSDDHGVDIRLNGLPTGNNTPDPSWGSWYSFVITSGFNFGVNTLDFVVDNTHEGNVALQVDMRGFYCACGMLPLEIKPPSGPPPGAGGPRAALSAAVATFERQQPPRSLLAASAVGVRRARTSPGAGGAASDAESSPTAARTGVAPAGAPRPALTLRKQRLEVPLESLDEAVTELLG
jgi:hypothetical protein